MNIPRNHEEMSKAARTVSARLRVELRDVGNTSAEDACGVLGIDPVALASAQTILTVTGGIMGMAEMFDLGFMVGLAYGMKLGKKVDA